ncbi:hypothetical protein D3C73_1193760 [compost metagenome]
MPLVHTWPELKKLAMTAMSAARSRQASGSTISADLPPSSSVTLLSVVAATPMTCLPVSTPPVNDTFATPGWLVSQSPISRPLPSTTLNTPLGTPACV